MKALSTQQCLGGYEFASYMAGTVYGQEKTVIEKHLSACTCCFEIFIDTFNQHLDKSCSMHNSAKNPPAMVH